VPLTFASVLLVSSFAAAEPASAPTPEPATEFAVPNEPRRLEGPTAVPAAADASTATEPASEPQPTDPLPTTDASDPGSAPELTTMRKGRQGLQRHRLVYKNLTALRYNPLGFVNELSIGYRLQLIDKNTTLFKESFVALKAHTFVNPAFGRVGPMLEIQPLALLNFYVIYNAVGYFKTFDQMQTFQSPAATYDDSTLEARTDQRYPGMGQMVTISAMLQAKAGRVAIRDNVKAYWTDFAMKKDPRTGRADTVYYDQTLDILQPDRGWVLTNDADALYLFDWGLKLGARYTYTHAFYDRDMYLPGESRVNRNNTHRVGPAILYSPPKWRAKAAKRTGLSRKRWYNPTAFLLMQWWAQHRWRTGEDVSPGMPYILLGFTFEGDIHP